MQINIIEIIKQILLGCKFVVGKILNFFKSLTTPYQGSSDMFIDVSNRAKKELSKSKPDLQITAKLISLLQNIAITQGDVDIISKHQKKLNSLLAEYY